ncbi:MAG TPA: DUF4010 domain-containing protein [Steroidobacteraceae bacterium]|nr:DUF4010 domain-containing protein [Steroidobacteraceae bacterium]
MQQTTPPLDQAGHMGLAVAMAVVMGLAFEGVYKREERSSPGGIRTFPMLTVLGTVLYLLERDALAPYIAGLAAVGVWLYAYIRSEPANKPSRPGLMVPAANLLAYTLGPIALTQASWVVVAVAVAAVLLLESRESLHRVVLDVPSDEIFTLSKFLILVGIILPLVPDRPIVPWTPITPFKAWLALVAVSSLSYVSYLLQRYLPDRSAVLWSAILGGTYSSTAITVALARRQRQFSVARSDVAVGIVAATAVMYLRVAAIVALFNMQLAWILLPAIGALFGLAALIAGWRWLRRSHDTAVVDGLDASNPLQLGTAVTFAALFVVLAVASAWVGGAFGQRGIYALAAVTGLADVDPFVSSLAQGGVSGMAPGSLAAAILIATSSNNLLKGCYALVFGGVRPALWPAVVLFSLAAVGLGAALVYVH